MYIHIYIYIYIWRGQAHGFLQIFPLNEPQYSFLWFSSRKTRFWWEPWVSAYEQSLYTHGTWDLCKKYGKSKYYWKNWLILSVEKYISPRVRQNSTGRDMLKTGFFGAVDYALHLGSSSSLAQVYDLPPTDGSIMQVSDGKNE